MSGDVRDAEFEHDCRQLMECLPATIAGRPLERGHAFKWEALNQRAVDVLYSALAYAISGDVLPARQPTNDELVALFGPAFVAVLKAARDA